MGSPGADVYLAQLGGLSQREIGEALGWDTARIGKAIRRAKHLQRENQCLAKVISSLTAQLQV